MYKIVFIINLSILALLSIVYSVDSIADNNAQLSSHKVFKPVSTKVLSRNIVFYYFDSTAGSDSNNGTSKKTPWKTLKRVKNLHLFPGDMLLFKRGEIWTDTQLIDHYYPSGTKDKPIVFSSYGNKNANKPIISSMKKMSFQWKSIKRNLWKTYKHQIVHRLFLNSHELLNARNLSEISLRQPWFYKNNILYLYSEINPKNLIFKMPSKITFYLQNQSFIKISELNIQAGESSALKIVGSSNINITNCKIGMYSSYGIFVKNSQKNNIVNNINIENNIFDSGFKLDYSWIKSGRKGADYIGSSDGIFLGAGVQNSLIYNNYFKDWNHASIGFSTNSKHMIKNNEIFNNTLTAPDIDYGGRICFSGNVTKNNIHHNMIFNIKVRNQIGGFENNFHHNIVNGVKNSHLKRDNIGQCISLEPYNGSVYNNKIKNNTLINCEGAAIKLIASINNDVNVSNNIFANNYIENNLENNEKEIEISKYPNVKSQIFINNYISNGVIDYKGGNISVFQLNKIGDNKNNTNVKSNEHGAGNKTLVGSFIKLK